ncbi:MAG: hypothetical protein LKE37_00090 [Atopobiaceae bacterium]|jgi:hypothetical protein|nr:hypothetical protein [Atopobiaceae bacterium]
MPAHPDVLRDLALACVETTEEIEELGPVLLDDEGDDRLWDVRDGAHDPELVEALARARDGVLLDVVLPDAELGALYGELVAVLRGLELLLERRRLGDVVDVLHEGVVPAPLDPLAREPLPPAVRLVEALGGELLAVGDVIHEAVVAGGLPAPDVRVAGAAQVLAPALPAGGLVHVEDLVVLAVADVDHALGAVDDAQIDVRLDRGVGEQGQDDGIALVLPQIARIAVDPVEAQRLVQDPAVVLEGLVVDAACAHDVHEVRKVLHNDCLPGIDHQKLVKLLGRHPAELMEVRRGIDEPDGIVGDPVDGRITGRHALQQLDCFLRDFQARLFQRATKWQSCLSSQCARHTGP